MRTVDTVTQQDFDSLLLWLDPDRERAGQKYETIRFRLIRVLIGRGCSEAEDLADETINRVARKLPHLSTSYTGNPIHYFYGVANRVHLEWLRKQKARRSVEVPLTEARAMEEPDVEYECLGRCLAALSSDKRNLIVEYYEGERGFRIQRRKCLVQRLGITESALQLKAFRIRGELRTCIRQCMLVEKA